MLTLLSLHSSLDPTGTLGQSSSNRLGRLSRRRCSHGRATQERRRDSGGHQPRSMSTQGCYRRSRSSSLPPWRSNRPQLEEEPSGPFASHSFSSPILSFTQADFFFALPLFSGFSSGPPSLPSPPSRTSNLDSTTTPSFFNTRCESSSSIPSS